MYKLINSNIEYRNPKQYQNINNKNPKRFENSNLKHLNLFRASDFDIRVLKSWWQTPLGVCLCME